MRRFQVGREAGALGETLPTERAAERFLPTVDDGVADQVELLGEGLPTLLAAERFLPRVTPQMLRHLREPHESFSTITAAEPLLAAAAAATGSPPGRPDPDPRQAAGGVGRGPTTREVGVLRSGGLVHGDTLG